MGSATYLKYRSICDVTPVKPGCLQKYIEAKSRYQTFLRPLKGHRQLHRSKTELNMEDIYGSIDKYKNNLRQHVDRNQQILNQMVRDV